MARMTTHSFELTDRQIHPRAFMPARAESMAAILTVKPPFEVPEKLASVALGSKADLFSTRIDHVGTVLGEGCYFEVSAADGSEPANLATLRQIGERVVRYADDPSQAAIMMRETPFAIVEE